MMKNLNYLKYLQQFIVLSLLAVLSTQVLAGKRTTTYMHTDALGSVVAASDKDGNLLWRKQYMPFGSEINRDPNLKELSYTGKKFDAELGLSYSGARYYDPSLGRFGGIDPATALENVEPNPMMFNRYAYANNNPYKFVDPDGKESIFALQGDINARDFGKGKISRKEYQARNEVSPVALLGLGGPVIYGSRGLYLAYLANSYRVSRGTIVAAETIAETTLAASAANVASKGLRGLQSKFDDLAETHLLPQFRKLDPNLTFGFTGSFRTGVVGNPSKARFGQSIDLNDFDVDFFIKSDVLLKKYGSNLRANPEFRKILSNTPGFEGLRPNKKGFSIKFLPSS